QVAPARAEQDLTVLRRGEPPRHRRAGRAEPALAPGEVLADRASGGQVAGLLEDGNECLAARRVREVLAAADVVRPHGGRTVELRASMQGRLPGGAPRPRLQGTARPGTAR